MGGVPLRRWVLEEIVDTRALSSVQAACVRHGGFVTAAQRFDARIFGVTADVSTVMSVVTAGRSGGVSGGGRRTATQSTSASRAA